jgi:glycosyltransferase involved in cell wall biosynthesis
MAIGTTMKIGIDATILPTKPTGAGVYTIHLIQELVSMETDFEFVVFSQKHGRQLIGTLPNKDSVTWITSTDTHPALRLLWEQTILPVFVQREKIDLLHSLHYTRPIILSELPSCASVVTFHDMTFFLFPHLHTRVKRIFFKFFIRLSAKTADAIITVSENTRRDTASLLGVPQKRIHTTTLGVDQSFKPIRDSEKLEEIRRKYRLPEKFILHIGTIEPRKNLKILIRAFSSLGKMGYDGNLVIVGQYGWKYKDLLEDLKTLGIEERVKLTGYIPTMDLPIVYNLAQIFVYPSLYEGFGIPPIEAMACGTPVITTAISAMADHVSGAGLLVAPQDEVELAQAMHILLKNRTLQAELSTKGQQRATSFTWKRTAQETLQVYRHLLKTR